MKKLIYYVILVVIFAVLLLLCSTIVSFIFNDYGSLVMYLMCIVVLGAMKFIQPYIKEKMKI